MKYIVLYLFYFIRYIIQIIFLIIRIIWNPKQLLKETDNYIERYTNLEKNEKKYFLILKQQDYFNEIIWEYFDGF